jgi:hypothetical protein
MDAKFIDAKQAREFYQFKNTKRKLYKKIAAIWYNNYPLQFYTRCCEYSLIECNVASWRHQIVTSP